MLAIRMQRTGRKGHAEFRIIVQDARRTPTSGAIVAQLGHYNPHSKQIVVNKEKAVFYLEHGAQPSDRVISLLASEGLKMPAWVKTAANKTRTLKNAEKLRKNRSEEPAVQADKTEPATEPDQPSAGAEAEAPAVAPTAVEAESTATPEASPPKITATADETPPEKSDASESADKKA